MSLLPRFYDDFDGEIKIDDVLIKDFDIKNLRSHIALVSQNITLFNDTIANNINYGSSNRDIEEIKEAAKKQTHMILLKPYLMDMIPWQVMMECCFQEDNAKE